MTADEALAWIEEHDAFVCRDQAARYLKRHTWYAHKDGVAFMTSEGATLIEAVTRLKAKLEAGQ